MKTNTFKTLFGSLLVSSFLIAAPAFAADVKASQEASFRVNSDGIVQVIGAEITSVSGNVINAVTRLKNNVVTWAFTTNASTTIVGGSKSSTTSDLRVGDKLNVTGSLTSLGSTIGVSAGKILDVTLLSSLRAKTGTVQSINTTNGTFTLKADDKVFVVQTNASTTFKLSKATTTQTLSNMVVGQKVTVLGTLSSDGSTITASQVALKAENKKIKKELDELKKKFKKDTHNNGKGRDDEIHSLKANLGLHFGLGR